MLEPKLVFTSIEDLEDENRALAREIRRLRAGVKGLSVDALAQEIRRVDGNHSLGAGALAEALMPFITRATTAKEG